MLGAPDPPSDFVFSKSALCSFGGEIQTQNFNIYIIKEVIIQTQKGQSFPLLTICSPRKVRSPEHSLKLERWQGLPNINKVKQYETVLSFKVGCLLSLLGCKMQRKLIHLVCLLFVDLLLKNPKKSPYRKCVILLIRLFCMCGGWISNFQCDDSRSASRQNFMLWAEIS